MTAFATTDDVEDRLPASDRHLATDDRRRTEGLIDEASVLVVGYLTCDPSDPGPVPDAVTIVTSRMVARVLQQDAAASAAPVPIGAQSTTYTSGPFSQTAQFPTGATSGSPWLTAADKTELAPYRCGGGMRAVGLRSDLTGRYRTIVPTGRA